MAPEFVLTKIQESVHNGAFEYEAACWSSSHAGPTAEGRLHVTRDEAMRILGKAFNVYQDDDALARQPHQWWVNGNTAAGAPVSLCVDVDDVNPTVVLVGTRSLPWPG